MLSESVAELLYQDAEKENSSLPVKGLNRQAYEKPNVIRITTSYNIHTNFSQIFLL